MTQCNLVICSWILKEPGLYTLTYRQKVFFEYQNKGGCLQMRQPLSVSVYIQTSLGTGCLDKS